MRASLALTITSTLVLAASAAFAGCASAADPPLGGPYGGTGSAQSPTNGTSTSPTDPAADPGSSGTASGGTSGTTSGGTSGTTSGGTSGTSGGTSGKDGGTSGGTSGTSGGTSGTSGGTSSSGGTTATWTKIYTSYLASGTKGNCAKSGCHSQMSTASGGYTWLKGRGYITASNAPLADPAQSCLSWLGGNMPPSGVSSLPAAAADLTAWAAAGAPNN